MAKMDLDQKLAIEEFETMAKALILRGGYKPGGESGNSLKILMQKIKPSLYRFVNDPERIDLEAFHYSLRRLPDQIGTVKQITVVQRITDGVKKDFEPIKTAARRRDTFRTEDDKYVTAFRGGMTDLFDFISTITCFQIETEKIRQKYLHYLKKESDRSYSSSIWHALDKMTDDTLLDLEENKKLSLLHELSIEFRTDYDTIKQLDQEINGSLLKLAKDLAHRDPDDFKIVFVESFALVGRYSTIAKEWSDRLVQFIQQQGFENRPLHIISSNTHSVINCVSPYVWEKLRELNKSESDIDSDDYLKIREFLKNPEELDKKTAVEAAHGIFYLKSDGGVPDFQLIDLCRINSERVDPRLRLNSDYIQKEKPIIVNFDYAFGEQGFYIMNELCEALGSSIHSLWIIGKAGILVGKRGEIMLPSYFVEQGGGNTYAFCNGLRLADFDGLRASKIHHDGPMLTVSGTFLQNEEVLRYFMTNWNALGMEMEGIPYARAIEQNILRKRLMANVIIGVAYYASDAPLSGDTLAVPLGAEGVKPLYAISIVVLNKILTGFDK